MSGCGRDEGNRIMRKLNYHVSVVREDVTKVILERRWVIEGISDVEAGES